MKKRDFDEMVSYFNSQVLSMDINKKHKQEILGMMLAIQMTVHDFGISKWIPVTEALPKDMDRLLATISRPDGEKRVRSGHYYKGLFMMDNGDTWSETDKGVLAWMPLPEPYRGEEWSG